MEIKSETNEINIKEELYILFLEIKGELNNRCIEIDKEQFDEKVSNFKTKTLINYLKEIVYTLLNNKFQIKPKEKMEIENNNNIPDINTQIYELENEIIKYQADIRNLIQKQFQYKIQKDAMETKLNSYKEMEKDYNLLKEKVKYEEGRFLNNDRKDNEILILREENSNLKKEILKNEKNSKNYETLIESEKKRIKELKTQLSQLNKKLILLESNQLILNNTNNNYSTIHNNTISTKGRTSSRWSKTKDRERDREEILISNISHLTSNNTNLSVKKKKIINTKYSKLEMRAIGNSNERTLSRGNSTNLIKLNSKKKRSNQGITTIDNNSKISETYNKIFNSLLSVKSNNNLTTKKTIVAKSHKKNSASMLVDNNYEKPEEKRNSKRSLSKKIQHIKNNTGTKHKIYNKLMNGIPNSKIPLTSKNNINKNLIPNLPQKYFAKNKSLINIKRQNKEYINVE
jgi:hypothetical protein